MKAKECRRHFLHDININLWFAWKPALSIENESSPADRSERAMQQGSEIETETIPHTLESYQPNKNVWGALKSLGYSIRNRLQELILT